jgi:endonuclease/exonuclease/phosphatase family metal-dependent hydrolase
MRALSYVLAVFLLVVSVAAAAAPFRYASWNLKHLGWKPEERNVIDTARVMNYFDFVAVQEVMNEEAVDRLRKELNRVSDSRWDTLVSHEIGRGSYKESYAFFWRTDRLGLSGGAAVYLDDQDVFAREPFAAVFTDRVDKTQFVASTVHILYGESRADRLPEIEALSSYWQWLDQSYGSVPLVMSGDFNIRYDDPAFDQLTSDAVPLIRSGATTLGTERGYANLYDNIWLDRRGLSAMPRAGIFKIPATLKLDHKKVRKTISDHAPVFAILNFAISP